MSMFASSSAFAGAITAFGNAAVLALLSGLIALWLWWSSGRRAAALWCLVVLGCTAATALLKIGFSACPWPQLQIYSPSGHTSFSTLVYGGAALSLGAGPHAGRRLPALALTAPALGFAAAIGWSRLVLRAHSGSEVMLGFAIGGLSLLAWIALSARLPHKRLPPILAIALAVIVLLAAQGQAVSVEPQLQRLGQWLSFGTGLCRAAAQP